MFGTGFGDKAFDIAFSQGVLEHYADDNIIRALAEQRRIARIVVIDVPSGRGKIGDYGDERSISPAQWRELIQASGLAVVSESARGMARWSERYPKLLGWLENSWIARHFGENSIFVYKEANNVYPPILFFLPTNKNHLFATRFVRFQVKITIDIYWTQTNFFYQRLYFLKISLIC